MRRAAQILFLVGMILSIITAVSCCISGIVCIVAGGNAEFGEMLAKGFAELMQSANYNGSVAPEELAAMIQGAYIGIGVWCIIIAAIAVVNAVFCSKARDGRPTRTTAILCIVFGILSSVMVSVVGAIFALICNSREQNQPTDTFENQAE